jgi:predicted Zn-dependent protease with MMP-like domain
VVEVSGERFEEMVADALDEIPPALGAEMENVAVVVEEWPNASQSARLAPGSTLLGLYEGVPITRRGPLSYSGVAPDRITIFRGPLSRLARDDADLAARVRVTVLHEVGHYFGMSDERLEELGWA